MDIVTLFVSVTVLVGLVYLLSQGTDSFSSFKIGEQASSQSTETSSSEGASESSAASDLPDVKASDWDLVLVNRNHPKDEMNPDLVQIDNIYVDSRIEQNVRDFLTAAQAIDSQIHLISGYRSVEYQSQLYNSYVEQEMQTRGITQEEAEQIVQTYSQPGGSSEHQTGLAIDMSAVDSLNENDPAIVSQLAAMAPDYGFVLRFLDGKQESTGIGYEDWHFRYVGKESARYMVDHHLTLEEYLNLLKAAGKE